jgi:uncharacterized protein (TIGR04255 family)
MPSRILKNKPLVETILEVKWALSSPALNVQLDPHYKLLLGRLYERLSDDYPEHEQLPSAMIPDEMSAHMVQHRFRHAAADWPLVQIGPGILTVNDTHKYTWDDFRARSLTAVQKLFEAHPKSADLKVDSLLLRYIDAVEFDYPAGDVYAFLREKLKVSIALPETLFKDTPVQSTPSHFSWQSAYACDDPKATMTVRFATGQKEEKPALLWETMVHTRRPDIPELPDRFATWMDAAHTVTDDWFFKLIEGDLEGRFSGD